ncbi:MAG: hypothetical protein PWQ12_188 [Clostridiales bacterium]|jgi:hypothetical protein|nr:hypothetical protein [Clostridiales bacterium]
MVFYFCVKWVDFFLGKGLEVGLRPDCTLK